MSGMIKGKCSRQIADSGWSMFQYMLNYKLVWSGGTLEKVNPAYTSQTCATCSHIDRASRVGDRFKCTNCGHEEHADTNAARIILNRANRSVQPVEASSHGTSLRNRKVKLRVPRRSNKSLIA